MHVFASLKNAAKLDLPDLQNLRIKKYMARRIGERLPVIIPNLFYPDRFFPEFTEFFYEIFIG